MDNTSITFEDLYSNYLSMIKTDKRFKNIGSATLIGMFLEMLAATSDMANFNLQRMSEEGFFRTAKLDSSYIKLCKNCHRAFTMEDIQEAGCITELCGRIQTVISLKRFEEEHFLGMLEGGQAGPIAELEAEFNIRLLLSKAKKEELAHEAFVSGLGIRGMKNQLRYYIDEAIWEDCKTSLVEVS